MTKKLAALAAALAAVAVVGAASAPAQAAKPAPIGPDTYAALGDSFASGFGAGESNVLGQSTEAYPVVLAGGPQNLDFRAMAGATTEWIPTQIAGAPDYGIPPISADARQVTLTVGGNDLGFLDKAARCADPAVPSCALTDAERAMLPVVTGRITGLIEAVHTRAPQAKVYVTGYPLLLQPQGADCVVGTLTLTNVPTSVPAILPAAKAAELDQAAVALNGAIRASVTSSVKRYAKYVDVTAAFTGHGLCGAADTGTPNPASFINPVSGTATLNPDRTISNLEIDRTTGPLHPNAAGQQAYAGALWAKGFKS